MNKNPFVKKNKYNPDVIVDHSKKINERTNMVIEKKDEYFNSQIEKTENNKLIEKLDNPISDLEKEIQKKLNERKNQEFEFTGKKNIIPTSNPNEFNQFNDLKNNDDRKKDNNKNEEKDDNYNNIMDDLRNLGILN